MIAFSLRRALKRPLASAPLWPIVARVLPPAIVVLAYHRVSVPGDPFRHVDVASFRTQMEWLRRHCTIVAPGELRRSLVDRSPSHRIPVLVTFDDGYRDFREHAYPVLQALGIPTVNFVATQFIDDGTPFWWDIVDLACKRTRLARVTVPWGDRRFEGRTASGRMRLYRECQSHLKQLPDAEKQAMVPRLLAALQLSVGDLALPRQVMTWDEIRATMPLTTYGGHLHTHPLVSRIDEQQLEQELVMSHARMQQELGKRPHLFAYPDGDITDSAKAALRRHGYTVAFGIIDGFVTHASDWMALRRIPGPQTVGDLAWRIAGLLRGRHAG